MKKVKKGAILLKQALNKKNRFTKACSNLPGKRLLYS